MYGNIIYKFNEIISGTPKKSEKEMGSVFQNAIIKFSKKSKNLFSLIHDLNTKKNTSKIISIFFLLLFGGGFLVRKSVFLFYFSNQKNATKKICHGYKLYMQQKNIL